MQRVTVAFPLGKKASNVDSHQTLIPFAHPLHHQDHTSP
jgi:hypothetical protein